MLRILSVVALSAALPAAPAQAQGDVAMLGDMLAHGHDDPHIALTPARPPAAGDAARATALAAELRDALERYRDVRVAEAEGYRRFGPANQPEVHYVHPGRARAERSRLDPARPGALLYAPRRDGSMRLVGAMFGAPRWVSQEELDARVPLSQARWHRHVNLCLPRPVTDRAAWRRRGADGQILFGAKGSIATAAECRAAGGRFHESLFGWMVHVYPFRADPADWWRQRHG